MKRRTFFGLVLACLGLSRFQAKAATQVQLAGRDYADPFALSQADALMQGQKAFSNRFLSRYEGKAIPPGVVFTQNVGRCKASYQNAYRPQTEKLKSTTKDT